MDRKMARRSEGSVMSRTASAARTLGIGAGLLWLIELVDLMLGGALDGLGIRPHSVEGLLHIPLAPFLHSGIEHLAMNTLPFLVLGALSMTRRQLDFWVVSVVGGLTSGLGAWVFGSSTSVHLGASGVIFAYLGFLMTRGLFERRLGPVLLSMAVLWLFGGMLWTALPIVAAGISWQAHMFGFLGGVLVARVLGRHRSRASS